MTVVHIPERQEGSWHFPYHEADRVIIEGRQIPGLRAMDDGDEVSLIVLSALRTQGGE
jgi:hypothetical protein